MSVLLLVLLLLLIAINSFFVAAEFAVVRSRRARLEQLRDEGVRGSTRALITRRSRRGSMQARVRRAACTRKGAGLRPT